MQSFELDKSDVAKIRQALEGDADAKAALLEEYHTSEIAILFEQLSEDERAQVINFLPIEVASEIISEMDAEMHPEELLQQLDAQKRLAILEELEYDDATDIISQLPQDEQKEILEEIDQKDASHIRTLLSYPEDSAGGLMNTQVIKVRVDMTKQEAINEIIRQSEEIEEYYTAYVVEGHDKLLGWVSLKELIKAKTNKKINEIYDRNVVFVKVETDQEEVAKLISQYDLTSMPVVDDDMRLLGRITFDDVIDVLEEENTEDILKISGVSEDEALSGTWIEAVRSRLPWLVINLGTAFLAASVIRHFDATVSRLVVLSSYMTMIAGMGGNAATQALAVTIRRISLFDLTDKQAYKTVLKELTVGIVNGACVGSIVFIVAFFYDANPILGLVIFIAMVCNLLIAGLAGASIPLLLKRIGVDPAVASSIIITTFTDVFGFLLLLSLASKLLL